MRFVRLICLAVAVAGAARAGGRTVADVQVVPLEGDAYVLRVRSSEPQAFDVVPESDPSRFTVRLYAARLGDLAPFDPPSGRLRVTEEREGHVLLRLERIPPGHRVSARQGTSPTVVELRVGR